MCYVGQTTRILKKRLIDHYCKNSCPYLYSAIKKYGKENFSVDILGKYDTLEDLNNAEEYYVDWYNCIAPNGYNLKFGGGSYGKHSQITLAKLTGRGPNKGFSGRKHTLETKLKIAKSLLGTKRKPYKYKKINQNT